MSLSTPVELKARKFVLAQKFEGEPKESNFTLTDEDLPPVKSGQVLVKAKYLSVDPYMRIYPTTLSIGDVMVGSQVGTILQSKSKDFPVGKYVMGYFGWRTHTVADPKKRPLQGFQKPYLVQEAEGIPVSLELGVLGMPGNTAYFCLLDNCRPIEGETVVVSAAAGAVGSAAGQIAKIKGCRVIGFAGSDTKVDWLYQLGFDAAFNYKTKDVSQSLQDAAPHGVDCYFDNVGGELSGIIMTHMNKKGRVAECGSISTYNTRRSVNQHRKSGVYREMETRGVKIEEFNVFLCNDRWSEGINAIRRWIHEGKLQYRETITEGFQNLPKAFIGLFKGANVGKAIVKIVK